MGNESTWETRQKNVQKTFYNHSKTESLKYFYISWTNQCSSIKKIQKVFYSHSSQKSLNFFIFQGPTYETF